MKYINLNIVYYIVSFFNFICDVVANSLECHIKYICNTARNNLDQGKAEVFSMANFYIVPILIRGTSSIKK